MKKIHLYLPLLILSILLQGCYKDKGNYTYHDINEVGIAFSDNWPIVENLPEVEVLQGDSLKITPILNSTIFGSESNYIYSWEAYVNSTTPVDINFMFLLDSNRNLDVKKVNIPPNNYIVYYKVTDKTTGITVSSRFRLRVIGTLSTGWIVMCDDNGKTRLSMKPLVYGNFSYIEDVMEFALAGLPPAEQALRRLSDEDLKGPIKMVRFGGDNFSPENYAFYLLTKGSTNRISNATFLWHPSQNVREHFANQSYCPTGFVADNMETFGDNRTVMMSGQGNLYYYNMTGLVWFSQPVNTLDFGKTFFKASPKFAGGSDPNAGAGAWIVFNEDNSSFYQISGFAKFVEPIPETPSTKISYKNLTGYTLEHILYNRISYGSAEKFIYIILKEKTSGNYNVLRASHVTMSQRNWQVMNAPEIEQSKIIAVGGSFAENIYYAVGNKVYIYNISDNTARVALTLPGEEITLLKFVNVGPTNLLVASYDGTPNGGTFAQYAIKDHSSDLIKIGGTEHTGFAKIVDVAYK